LDAGFAITVIGAPFAIGGSWTFTDKDRPVMGENNHDPNDVVYVVSPLDPLSYHSIQSEAV
jgi:hypothetical protein